VASIANLERRIQLLEQQAPAPARIDYEETLLRIGERLEARNRASLPNLEAKQAELRALQAREPWDQLYQLRLDLLSIDIQELEGTPAETCERARLDAHARVSGRRWATPDTWQPQGERAAPPENAEAEALELQADTEPADMPRPRMCPQRDRLGDYRGNGRALLEPSQV
jgi:hypothetical protein